MGWISALLKITGFSDKIKALCITRRNSTSIKTGTRPLKSRMFITSTGRFSKDNKSISAHNVKETGRPTKNLEFSRTEVPVLTLKLPRVFLLHTVYFRAYIVQLANRYWQVQKCKDNSVIDTNKAIKRKSRVWTLKEKISLYDSQIM